LDEATGASCPSAPFEIEQVDLVETKSETPCNFGPGGNIAFRGREMKVWGGCRGKFRYWDTPYRSIFW
jgi:hypothetical protein